MTGQLGDGPTLDGFRVEWSVTLVPFTQMLSWSGSVQRYADDSEGVYEEVGHVEAYVVPSVSEVDLFDLTDAQSGDLEIIGSALTLGPYEDLVEEHGEPVFDSLLIVDKVTLDDSARGLGVAAFAIGMLVYANPSASLVACYPHPMVNHQQKPPVEVIKAGQRRLADHWQQYGFVPLENGHGVHVAHPDRLRPFFTATI